MVTSRPKIIKSFDHPMDIRIRYVDYKFGSDRGARELSRVSRANFVSFFGSTTGFPSILFLEDFHDGRAGKLGELSFRSFVPAS